MRLCANTWFPLPLIRPVGFRIDDKKAHRVGLDYHGLANMTVHVALDAHVAVRQPAGIFGITTKGWPPYHVVSFAQSDALGFGPETRGLPAACLEHLSPEHLSPSQRLRIPMKPKSCSVNVSHALAVVVYAAWRQLQFPCSRIKGRLGAAGDRQGPVSVHGRLLTKMIPCRLLIGPSDEEWA